MGGATGAATGGWEAAAVLGEVLLPIAAAAILSEITGGSLSDVFGRHLVDSLTELARDLLELNVASTILAITAAEAAALSLKDLWSKLVEAANASAIAALAILTAELIRRFPACAGTITAFLDAAKLLQRPKRSDAAYERLSASQRRS